MTARPLLAAILPLVTALAITGLNSSDAAASEKDRRFFSQVEGQWSGPGEIVAGKYKGTRFNCNFTGMTPSDSVGMTLEGGCRVGLFTQRMSATVEHKGREGYRGTFMDGAVGEGLDVVSGTVNDSRVVFSVNRNDLNGAVLANLPDGDTMHVTVSVEVQDQLVPVIGMNLSRSANRSIGSVGSIAR